MITMSPDDTSTLNAAEMFSLKSMSMGKMGGISRTYTGTSAIDTKWSRIV